jgi:outer membrane protein TolC
MEAHARDMRNLHSAGLATENEALAAEVQRDRNRLRLDEARGGVEVARARIAFLTGQTLPPDSAPESAAGFILLEIPSEGDLLALAFHHRSEPMARSLEMQAAREQVRGRRAEYFPHLSLVAHYEQARPNPLNIPPEDRWQGAAFAGVSLSWSLFDFGLTKGRVAEASARAAQAQARLDQTREVIALEVREARIHLQTARDRVTVAGRVERSAQRNLESANHLWRNGLARHSDVLDADAQWTDAQSELSAARADLRLARAALDRAVGGLTVDSVERARP